MSAKYYNTSIRNLTYRLRRFKDYLSDLLEEVIREKEDVIISAVVDDQLFRRGVNGNDVKIWSYAPYTASTVKNKIWKGQPATRVTLRDTGAFHKSVYLVYDTNGFYLTSDDKKAEDLRKKYGNEIFRLTDKNLKRILDVHIRRELVKRLKQQLKQQ